MQPGEVWRVPGNKVAYWMYRWSSLYLLFIFMALMLDVLSSAFVASTDKGHPEETAGISLIEDIALLSYIDGQPDRCEQVDITMVSYQI